MSGWGSVEAGNAHVMQKQIHFSMHYFSNNSAACRQLLRLYYGYHFSRHWSDVLF